MITVVDTKNQDVLNRRITASHRVCPFGRNERQDNHCLTVDCMAWTDVGSILEPRETCTLVETRAR